MALKLSKKLSSLKATLKAHFFGMPTPLSVTIAVVGRCNYRCAYCKIWQQKKARMTTGQLLELIDQLSKMGTQRIGITQDEPLLHKDIGKIIDFCKERDIFVTLGTNGSLLEERIDQLKNLDVVIFSFDGPPEVHDRHRIPGAYDNVVNAMKVASARGIEIWTTTVLTKYNLDCIDYILEKAEELKFKAAFQLLYHSPQVAGSTESLLPPAQGYRRAIETLMEKKREGSPIINSFTLLKYLRDWPDYEHPFYDEAKVHKRKLKCWSGELFFHIESNGDVYPCTQLIGKPANWLDVGLKKAMDSAKENRCPSCCLGADYIEYNLLFSLHPEPIWNVRRM
jgi:MoaA/NifB/PqqE/SkfB family radical SAM enzyme